MARSFRRRTGALGLVVLLAAGCDEAQTPRTGRAECEVGAAGTPGTGCPGQQICLGGRCYEPCLSDSDCSRWERCASSVCVAATTPKDDGGVPADGDADADVDGDADADLDLEIVDGGETDRDGDSCPCPAGYRCHEVTGACVQCTGAGQCTPQICDIGRGTCVDAAPVQCAPCDPAIAGSCGLGSCVDRRPAVPEVVCLMPCAAGCGQGTACSAETCVPATGVSCSAWFSTSRGRSCVTGADCSPIGFDETTAQCASDGFCSVTCVNDTSCPAGRTCDVVASNLCVLP